MNGKVFIRTFFLVAVLAAVAFTVYANKTVSERSSDVQAESSQTIPAGGSAIDDGTDKQGNSTGSAADAADTTNTAQEGNSSKETSDKDSIPSRNYVKEKTVISISALGDVALGQDLSFKYGDSFNYVFEKIKGDYSYFFSNVVSILSKDDLTIANLETTLSNETEKAEKYDYGNNYWFIGSPKYANILTAGSVEVANLANNHTYDYGQKGYDETCKALEDCGIEYFGYSDILYKNIKGIKIGIIGFNQLGNVEQGLDMNVFKMEVEEKIKKLREECNLVIANFHWGKEYQYEQNALQEELGHLAVDSGADLVIGNHPHVLQPVEKYKGKYITYSLGNFCFGGVKTPKDYDTAIYQQTFAFDSDNVLQSVEAPTIIPCSVSSLESLNNYKPALAAEPRISRVYSKLSLPIPGKNGQELEKSAMVRIDDYIDNILIELRYAGSDNVVEKPVYESDICYLRKGTADKLAKANEILLKQGYILKVWDGYRAQKYQQYLYDNAPDKAVFMNPNKCPSNHTRGAAVDCTLVAPDGWEVDMPSDFDDGSSLAYRTYEKCTEEQKKNAMLLETVMKSCGFIPLKSEWWHFDDDEYKTYPAIEDYSE